VGLILRCSPVLELLLEPRDPGETALTRIPRVAYACQLHHALSGLRLGAVTRHRAHARLAEGWIEREVATTA
jgi:hypothetical protein